MIYAGTALAYLVNLNIFTPFIKCNYHQYILYLSEYYNCNNPKSLVYVDDVYCIIQTKNDDIWSNVKKYIEIMQTYFNGNQLVINVDKTQVMIIRNLSKNTKKQKKINKTEKKTKK